MINFKVNYHNVDIQKITEELSKVQETTNKYHKIFTTLPSLNIINEVNDLNEINLIAEQISKGKDQFIVLGTGGSSLGARALINILNEPKPKKIKLHGAMRFMKSAHIIFKPRGVVGVITPWNGPFILSLNPTIQALLGGNAVIIKPSEVTPFSVKLAYK